MLYCTMYMYVRRTHIHMYTYMYIRTAYIHMYIWYMYLCICTVYLSIYTGTRRQKENMV